MKILIPSVVYLVLLFVRHTRAQQGCQDDSECLHGGTCKKWTNEQGDESHSNTGGASTYCHCAANYTGSFCQQFCPISCHNGGICKYKPTEHSTSSTSSASSLFQDYFCDCRSGWKGLECDIRVHVCPDGILECLHGATCRVSDENDDAQLLLLGPWPGKELQEGALLKWSKCLLWLQFLLNYIKAGINLGSLEMILWSHWLFSGIVWSAWFEEYSFKLI